jgi:hypothetical protein
VSEHLFNNQPVATVYSFPDEGYMMLWSYRGVVHFCGVFASFEEAAKLAKDKSSKFHDDDSVAAMDMFEESTEGDISVFYDTNDHSFWTIQPVGYKK